MEIERPLQQNQKKKLKDEGDSGLLYDVVIPSVD